MNIEECRHVFFLGIGGIGMSAIARYLNYKKIKISGYDRDCNELTKKLEAEGMAIHYTDNVDNIPDHIDLIIYTPAIPKDCAEYVWLKSLGKPILKRSQALQLILANKHVVAVAGTHGKTSTSALLAHILHSQGFESSAFIGGLMKNYHSNFIYGDGDWVVVEADEYDRSFLRLHPDIAVIQALDADHLDIYGKHEEMIESFKAFTKQIKTGGSLWIRSGLDEFWNNSDWQIALKHNGVSYHSFGLSSEGEQNAKLKNVIPSGSKVKFELELGNQTVECVSVMRGVHNALNATAAAAVAHQLGLTLNQIKLGIASFEGIERRFELVLESENCVVIDDYAHHPEEIKAAINTARANYPDKKLTVVFQPHLYTRTRDFKDGFAESLDMADEVLLLDIYPAREIPIAGVDSEMILSLMTIANKKCLSKEGMLDYIDKEKIEVLLLLGAGDINKLIPRIKEKLA